VEVITEHWVEEQANSLTREAMKIPTKECREIIQRIPYPIELENSPPSHMEEEEDARTKEVVKQENNYGDLHSNEAKNGIEDEFFEPPIQEVLDKEFTLPISLHLCPEFRVVKIIKESTEKRDCDQGTKDDIHEKKKVNKKQSNTYPNKQGESS